MLLRKYGAGIVTGAADDDPTGISTYSVIGATTGLSQMWLLLLSTPMLVIVQGMCAKIGDVTRKGLGKVIEDRYGFSVALLATMVLIISNMTTISADLLGLVAGLNLLMPQIATVWFIPPVTVLLLYLVLFKSYRLIEKFLLLMALFLATYIISGIMARPDWPSVIKALVIPHIEWNILWLAAAVGLLGTTITPYLFYWQTTEEVEEHRTIQQGRKALKAVIPGMIYSNVVSGFIIIAAASVFYDHGITITSARDAALALAPLAGNSATVLFAIGMIGSGLLAIPVLAASTSYAVAETFGWKEGLDKKVKQAKGFYAVMTVVFFVSAALAASGIDPIKALFFSQVLAGLLAPILLTLIILLAADSKVMGQYKNNMWTNIGGWVTVGVMFAASAAFLYQLISGNAM